MSDQNKGFQKEEAPKTVQGAQGSPSAWKRLLAKKWVFPATYVAAAAIILTLMWVYQDTGTKTVSQDDLGIKVSSDDQAPDNSKDGAVAVNAPAEAMQWPVKDRAALDVSIPFYDTNATNEVKQAAMIQYNDQLTPHTAIDLKAKDGAAFDVLAAMSGKVTAVEQNPVVGNLVEITHSNGLISVYQSLAEVKVTKGAEVKKGDVIAKAGRNDFEKEDGVHLHFEVRQVSDNAALNPETILNAKQ
ncbi:MULTISPECIES: M23 family metallopeptidase [Paenibacillus]|uniref:Peptidoglycan DD-metalloendopeptidase family protein n=1 Tax=Paenibacillus anseongense TaxID=2682845 RepID=A0ABW9U368_9BACL|nr:MULTISPECIES: M23 family metallopeptidase [Paenibacillus]MBA2942443.1 M23 family metallopeptidase [Paenibacillus sp. CGMCC 1.16610]MEC0266668.1 M23 family metallopeptidase [Paenibacillus anseongense]MVQ34517.1 peptidoglycan DD-metalloendopeptidase family protein [Paenibacillus anseongense]